MKKLFKVQKRHMTSDYLFHSHGWTRKQIYRKWMDSGIDLKCDLVIASYFRSYYGQRYYIFTGHSSYASMLLCFRSNMVTFFLYWQSSYWHVNIFVVSQLVHTGIFNTTLTIVSDWEDKLIHARIRLLFNITFRQVN